VQVQNAKPGYKIIKWHYGKVIKIPESWDVERLGKLCKLRKNGKVESNLYVGLEHIAKSSNTLEGRGNVAEFTSTKNEFHEGDVLYGKLRPNLNKVWLATEPGYCSTDVLPIVASQKILNRMLLCILSNHYFYSYAVGTSAGTKMPRTNWPDIKKFIVFLPSLKEQQKIASILSNVNSLIQQYDSIIESTKKIKTGLMQQLLTKGIGHTKFKEINFHFGKIINIPKIWKLEKLREYTLKIGSGITPRGGSKIYKTTGIPLIRSQNVQFDGLKLDDVAFISKEIHENMKNTKLDVHDVLLNITGASIGRCTYVPDHLKEGNVNQHVCIIRPKKDVDYRFLTYFLSTKFMQDIINSSQAGLSRQGLNFEEIGNYLIPIPHIDEQKEIAFILNNISSRINHLKSKKSNLEILKKGLMQKLLTGQLQV